MKIVVHRQLGVRSVSMNGLEGELVRRDRGVVKCIVRVVNPKDINFEFSRAHADKTA